MKPVRLVLCLVLSFAAMSVAAQINRDRAQVRAFRAENPCPATSRTRGACPGWEIDHAVPLCAGGADHPSNLQWLRKEDHRFKTLVDVKECRRGRRKDKQ